MPLLEQLPSPPLGTVTQHTYRGYVYAYVHGDRLANVAPERPPNFGITTHIGVITHEKMIAVFSEIDEYVTTKGNWHAC